ncbi:hypothetical protein FPV67DRAFT_1506743 [Lyophyllum atratum]|nr:hypothetical protein FPV67DRAFT_1506743 [Lyophyllum atratum]
MSTQSRSTMRNSNRESNGVRASVFDVCMQLGVLDDNSLVGEWMFNDPSKDGDSSFRRQNRTTRFQEVMSAGWEATEEKVPTQRRRHHFHPFSGFTARLRARHRHQASVIETSDTSLGKPLGCEVGPDHISLSRRSFFRRSIHKHDAPRPTPSKDTKATCDESGRVSTRPRSFFQRKIHYETTPPNAQQDVPPLNPQSDIVTPATSAPPLNTEPIVPPMRLDDVPEDDGDDEWEEIEALPMSPLYPLHNKGINPPPFIPLDKTRHSTAATTDTTDPDPDADIDIRGATHHNLTFAFPRLMFRRSPGRTTPSPSPQKKRTGRTSPPKSHTPSPAPTPTPSPRRKPLSILTSKAKLKHHRGLSSSLPPSPFVLLTSNSNSTMPQPTSRIVFSEDVPVRPTSLLSEAERRSMGYHNQFFVNKGKGEGEDEADVKEQGQKKPARRPKSVSVPTPPKKRAGKGRGEIVEPKLVAPVPFPAIKDEVAIEE